MRIQDVMSRDVQVARPNDTLQEVAARMAAGDFGFIPVADGDKLVGAITDRDITVRAVAAGAAPTDRVVEFLSRDALVVRADEAGSGGTGRAAGPLRSARPEGGSDDRRREHARTAAGHAVA